MVDDDHIQVAKKPSDLKGTALDRREFLRMVQVGGAITLGPSLAGCTESGGSGPADSTGTGEPDRAAPEELVIAHPQDANLLDPHKTTYSSASQVMSLLYDGMVRMDEGHETKPALGNGFEWNDDGTEAVIEFNIDSGITFHNGDDFTVDDVVFTFERFLEESLLRSWAIGTLQGVEKVNDRKVKFKFEEPYAFLEPHTAVNSYYGILPKDLAGKSADEFARNPVGTGPYKLESWVQDEKIVLTRNEDWKVPTYDAVESDDPPVPKKITWQVIPSATPRIQGLLSGDIDVLTGVPTQERQQIKESNKADLHSHKGISIVYVPMHNELPPTDDVKVRKAIAHAIDKERVVQDIYNGAGQVNYSPMPASYPSWASDTVKEQVGYVYDPAKAEQFLSDAGWEEGSGDYRQKDGETLTLKMVSPNAPPSTLQTSKEVASMLGEVGIKVDLTTSKVTTAYSTMREGNTHLITAGLGWMTADVMQFMLSSAVAGSSNLQFLKDDKVDQYLNQAAKTIDQEKRAELYKKMQLRVMEVCATVPIMTPNEETAVSSELEGYNYIPGSAGNVWLDIHKKNG